MNTSTNNLVTQPREVIQHPATVHEHVRYEQVEEIQPVLNIEKFKTQVIQKTQPLLDKEVRAVHLEQKTLDTEIMPEVLVHSGGIPRARDVSTIDFMDTANMRVEKPPIIQEHENQRVIEEIQPVIYRETIVPTLIKETKPIYQKIVEDATYVQEVLPPKELHSTQFSYPRGFTGYNQPLETPRSETLPTTQAKEPMLAPKKNFLEEKTTTTTTTAPLSQNVI